MTWTLVYSEINPLQPTWQGPWTKTTGQFFLKTPMLPADFIRAAKAEIVASPLVTLLDCALYSSVDSSIATDHYYIEVTFGPGPTLAPTDWGTVNTIKKAAPWAIAGIAGWLGKGTVNKAITGSPTTNASISGMMEPIMMIMMLGMMMPMMQNMTKASD